jgi:hypothetical protein
MLTADDLDELQEDLGELLERFESIKRKVRQADRHLYERWKAGGFLVDSDIVSMYPHVGEVVESLEATEEEEDDE